MKIVVLDGYALNPGDLSWGPLEKLGVVKIYDRTLEPLIVGRASGTEAILTNKAPLRGETLKAMPGLKYIGVMATGVDIVDVEAARDLGITVTNVPSYGTDSVAQFTIALLLDICHRVGLHSEAVRGGKWSKSEDWCFTRSPQIELAGKTFGVVGFGRIGRKVAEIARALGMQILAASPKREELPVYENFEWATLEELLMASDVVSLHCPLTPGTRGLISAQRLALMKPTAFLLNTSRGPLVDDQALASALNQGRLAGAAIDVLPAEPPPAGHLLFSARNCIVTPHMAWATREARMRCMKTVVENIMAFLDGCPRNVVSSGLQEKV